MAYRPQGKHAPIDESVVLPAAIRAASAKSDALHKSVYSPEQQVPNGEDGKAQTPEPEVKAAPEPEAAKPTSEAPAAGSDWEHRYNSMKGRNDKNEKTIADLLGELNSLRNDVANLKRQPTAEPVRTAENTFKKITAEEREAFGDDFIDVSARAAREQIDPEIAELRSKLANLEQNLGNVAKTTHDTQTLTMNQTLDRELPNWKIINRDPKFLAWVNLRDPYSNAIRVEMMRAAHASGDAQRVLNFFKGFLADEATTAPASPTPDVTSEGNKVPLESFAAPGRAKASASAAPTAGPDDKEIITRAQVQEFYKLVNQGHYRGRDAEKADLETRIFNANRDGRIR